MCSLKNGVSTDRHDALCSLPRACKVPPAPPCFLPIRLPRTSKSVGIWQACRSIPALTSSVPGQPSSSSAASSARSA